MALHQLDPLTTESAVYSVFCRHVPAATCSTFPPPLAALVDLWQDARTVRTRVVVHLRNDCRAMHSANKLQQYDDFSRMCMSIRPAHAVCNAISLYLSCNDPSISSSTTSFCTDLGLACASKCSTYAAAARFSVKPSASLAANSAAHPAAAAASRAPSRSHDVSAHRSLCSAASSEPQGLAQPQ